MFKKAITALGLTSILFAFSSCEKDDPNYDIIDVSKQKMLSQEYWKLEEYTRIWDSDNPELIPVSIYHELPSCYLDNFLEFTMNNELIEHEGYTKCAVSDPDQQTRHFSLSAQESIFVVWTNPDDPEGSQLFSADIEYTDIEHFNYSFYRYNPVTEKTEFHNLYYTVK